MKLKTLQHYLGNQWHDRRSPFGISSPMWRFILTGFAFGNTYRLKSLSAISHAHRRTDNPPQPGCWGVFLRSSESRICHVTQQWRKRRNTHKDVKDISRLHPSKKIHQFVLNKAEAGPLSSNLSCFAGSMVGLLAMNFDSKVLKVLTWSRDKMKTYIDHSLTQLTIQTYHHTSTKSRSQPNQMFMFLGKTWGLFCEANLRPFHSQFEY